MSTPPSHRFATLDWLLSSAMSAWLWFLLVTLLVLPVALRLYADDEPRNQEPGDGQEDGDPGEALAAA